MSQYETATDRLVSVIRSIQMAQGNGVLTVKRGEGGTLEEGTIVFFNGQVIQTTVGRRSGVEALNWLSTWGRCRYFFASRAGEVSRQTQPLNAVSSTNPGNTRPTTRDLQLDTYSSPAEKQPVPLLPAISSRW